MMAASSIGKRRLVARVECSESYQLRRNEIATAAVRVFNRLGFKGASMRAVAAELDIDRPSLYYYVSSKEELFDFVIRDAIERLAAVAKHILTRKVSPRHKLRLLITALMSSCAENYPLMYIYIRENLGHVSNERSDWSKQMRTLNRKIANTMISIIDEGYADNSFRKIGSSRVVAYGVIGIIGWTHRWFRPGTSEVGANEIGEIYAEMMLSGLRSAHERRRRNPLQMQRPAPRRRTRSEKLFV
jgi:AcrR family transcriptional regulator